MTSHEFDGLSGMNQGPIFFDIQFAVDGSFFVFYVQMPESGRAGFSDPAALIYRTLANGTPDGRFGNAGLARFDYRVSQTTIVPAFFLMR